MLSLKALKPAVDRPVPFSPWAGAPFGPQPGLPRPAAAVPVDAQHNNPLRRLAFLFGAGFLFLALSVLPELILYFTHVNTYLLYLFAPPAMLGVLLTGGFRRTLQYRASWFWIAFFAWIILATPFSYWRGGSTNLIFDYARVAMPLLFIVGGLAITWKEIRIVFYTIASAGLVNLLTARLFTQDVAGRVSLESTGTIGNSNDLAAHLLLVLPFILFIVMDRKRNALIRYPLAAAIAYGIFVIAGTASRGALIALAVTFLFVLWRAKIGRAHV